jgi:hypothetical protein
LLLAEPRAFHPDGGSVIVQILRQHLALATLQIWVDPFDSENRLHRTNHGSTLAPIQMRVVKNTNDPSGRGSPFCNAEL